MSDIFENKKSAMLAPMAGVTDSAMRVQCHQHGASLSVSEMVSARSLCRGDKTTVALLYHTAEETPFGVQLFGDDPAVIAHAAVIATQEALTAFIDINMGCPAPKITKSGAGSALMCKPLLCAEIVAAVAAAIKLPVTVKIRSGWSENTAAAHAKLMQDAGASAVFVHPRTREQAFSGEADLSVIQQVKSAVTIPVIGNGDIKCGADAIKMLSQTGCDSVMVGRAALGNPFVFEEIAAALTGADYCPPTRAQRVAAMLSQVSAMCEEKGERLGMLEARKHIAWYLKGFRGASALRVEAMRITTLAELELLARAIPDTES